jgi:hypothetical protein
VVGAAAGAVAGPGPGIEEGSSWSLGILEIVSNWIWTWVLVSGSAVEGDGRGRKRCPEGAMGRRDTRYRTAGGVDCVGRKIQAQRHHLLPHLADRIPSVGTCIHLAAYPRYIDARGLYRKTSVAGLD